MRAIGSTRVNFRRVGVSIAAQTFNTAQLLATVLIFALAGVVIRIRLRQFEQRLAPWRESTYTNRMARG